MAGIENSTFDVIVLGAGPAGCATAIACAGSGLKTLLLEREQRPDRLPGESLPPAAEGLFEQLGVHSEVQRAGFLRHTGYWTGTEAQTTWKPFGVGQTGELRGYQACRPELDRILQTGAAKAGALLEFCHDALRPVVEENRVTGISGPRKCISASFLVDATGYSRWLSRRLGLTDFEVSPRLIARFGWTTATPNTDQENHPGFAFSAAGYRWTAKIRPDLKAWTCVCFNSDFGNEGVRARSRDVTWRISVPMAQAGYFLVGDAAFIVDPASSHGVLKALMSGMVCAQCIKDIHHGRRPEKQVVPAYNAWMRNWFCQDSEALLNAYAGMETPPDWIGSCRSAVRAVRSIPFS